MAYRYRRRMRRWGRRLRLGTSARRLYRRRR